MPRAPRAARIKAKASIAATSGSTDIDNDAEADEGPPTKRAKGKGKGKATGQKTAKRATWKPIDKPPLCKEWKDIPDWKGREDSPLMGLPVEVMDEIFCVRPELEMSDYLALSGTCTFFRNHLTEDFWEAVCPQDSRSGTSPFSRFVGSWKVPHPKRVLDDARHPIVSTHRQTSKWSSGAQNALPKTKEPYESGHYVPPGPRSTWSRSQYNVYKEEQASWRVNRNESRVKGLKQLRDELTGVSQKQVAGTLRGIDWGRHSGDDRQVIKIELDGESGIEYIIANSGSENHDRVDSISSHASISEGNIKQVVDSLGPDPVDSNAAHLPWSSENVFDYNDGFEDPWEAPNSEATEPGDDFQWLWDQGAKIVHDHWPSPWRCIAAEVVNSIYVSREVAMKRYRLNEWELSTLKSFTTGTGGGVSGSINVYRKQAAKARAYKFRGGPAAHERYVAALVEREEAKTRLKLEKIRASIAAGTRKHIWRDRDYIDAEFSCCEDDDSMCYCKFCWDGQCDCGDHGKDPERYRRAYPNVTESRI